MSKKTTTSLKALDTDAALRSILEGTAMHTGEGFFKALVTQLVQVLNTPGSWVTEYLEEKRRLNALAFLLDGKLVENFEFDMRGTPCETAIESADLVHFPDRLIDLYPDKPDLGVEGVVSYLGVPLRDLDGKTLGHLAVVDRRPMPANERVFALFRIFAARATAELSRIRREKELAEREQKLRLLVGSAMDAIIELNEELRITRANAAAEKTFGCREREMMGAPLSRLLEEESYWRLRGLISRLSDQPADQQCLWIPEGLTARRKDEETFPAEATLSRFEMQRRFFYTLILRNVNDRKLAEEQIRSLSSETEYLRQEIKSLHNFDEIIGQSDALLAALRDVEQVADTDSSVLLLGETGTGKELFARAIHNASSRKIHPLVKVNCAAIPSNLIESEFFGHEKGAFTGAATRREGRFSLAHESTIFLDEIGELPLDLQGKLLRVLQEGEFEPVGSSRTQRVNVRVVAATNRDLEREVRDGQFRQDLFYRLNVFPIHIPPLRERGDDVGLLAQAFLKKFSTQTGRSLAPLSRDDIRRLMAYDWPGNVRELENVIERAVITARGGALNLDRALPEISEIPTPAVAESGDSQWPIRTIQELQELERQNILRALETCEWKVSGPEGAASRLGMNPSTLNSRMKALSIKRPR